MQATLVERSTYLIFYSLIRPLVAGHLTPEAYPELYKKEH